MRTPLGIGVLVSVAIVLAIIALLHLASVRRSNGGRWLWAALCVFVPFAGPITYLAFGRRTPDDDAS